MAAAAPEDNSPIPLPFDHRFPEAVSSGLPLFPVGAPRRIRKKNFSYPTRETSVCQLFLPFSL